MSYMKRIVENIMELWEEGTPLASIAERLRVPLDVVENVVDEHSNFFD